MSVFIDDVEENVATARAIGLAGIRFENTEPAIAEIERVLNHQA